MFLRWRRKSELVKSESIFEAFKEISTEEWLKVLLESISKAVVRGVQMPGYPDSALQASIVGSSNEHALREAWGFYREILDYAAKHHISFGTNTALLDFGCGWGRNYRFFLKNVPASNLHGIDVDPTLVELCKSIFPVGNFHVVNPLPPTDFPNNHFDIIYAYSVFSHLSEQAHLEWLKEFCRILKPAGLLIVTTQAKGFLDYCESLRQAKEHPTLWHQSLSISFGNLDEARKCYDEGGYLFEPSGGGGVRTSDFYGDTLISPGYVRREWVRFLEIIDFVDDKNRLAQAMIVAKKRLD